MSYLDKYPNCNGCPVYKYCGTMAQSTKLCNSIHQEQENKHQNKLK